LVSDQDIGQLKLNFEASFPELNLIRTIYQALGNYFQIPVGTGRDSAFDFDLIHFSKNYGFSALEVFHALKLLEKDGMILLSEGITAPSRIFVSAKREDLYRIQVEQPSLDPFIKLILRNYPGIMTDFAVINESDLARKLNVTTAKVEETIHLLQKLNVLSYAPHKEKPQLIFTSERHNKEDLILTKENYQDRKSATLKRVQSVIDFVTNNEQCRNIQLLGYFGEQLNSRCGKCDVCIRRNSLALTEIEFETIKNAMKDLLLNRAYPVFELVSAIDFYTEEKILEAVRWLIDNKIILKDENDNLIWRKQLEI